MPENKTLNDEAFLRDESIRRLNLYLDTILKVSTATLAFSVTFRTSVVGKEPHHLWLLPTAWIAFTLVPVLYCIVQICYGAMFSELIGADTVPHDEKHLHENVANRLATGAGVSVILVTLAFLVGIVSFGTFAALNAH